MFHPTGTQIAYFHLCHRKLWLFSHGIQMEYTSALVAEGKFIDEHSYTHRAQRWQELAIENIKIDHYDAVRKIIREVKKSNRKEEAHIAQLKYYLYVMERNDIDVKYGILEYPTIRMTEEVWLSDEDRVAIPEWEIKVKKIISKDHCPDLIKKTICKRCAYFEFCFIEEAEE